MKSFPVGLGPLSKPIAVLLALWSMAVFGIAACGDWAAYPDPLAETGWQLAALGDADNPTPVVGEVTIDFTADADVTGWTGCNAYDAAYRVQGSELRLDDLRWTERGCPTDTLFWQEQMLQTQLTQVARFEIDGDRLTLHGEGGQVLIFESEGST